MIILNNGNDLCLRNESVILPYFSRSPTVQRNTPPKATSSPNITEIIEYNKFNKVTIHYMYVSVLILFRSNVIMQQLSQTYLNALVLEIII